MAGGYDNGTNSKSSISNKYAVRCRYFCAGCRRLAREFFLIFSPDLDWVMKIGQYPSWNITGDKNIESLLGDHKKHYRNGLICESQGYGIAAFAYYRRITEEIIDGLLEQIKDLVSEPNLEPYVKALERVKTQNQASKKIQLVKNLLPKTLEIEGMNPLGIMYHALSEGIHSMNDETCLVHAEAIRESLIYLTKQISVNRNAKIKFSEKMKKILEQES